MKAQKSLFKRGYDRLELPDKNVEITLDSQQDEAVHTRSSMALVVAGAGSGKTRVLTERVKFLLSDGVSPHSIIAITFTNMAAEEMKERLSDVEGIGDVFIGTIHSFANKVMKLHSDKNYRIYNDDIDNDFHRELISKYCKSLTFDRYLEYKDIHNLVEIGKLPDSALQDVLMPSERAELDLIERSPSEIQCEIDLLGIDKVQFPESIKTLCKKRNVITFDQLLRMATDYFNSINATIGHVLVDELQDVGTLEFNFIESLQADNYFLVGDDWQSIYSFKGGNVNIFLKLIEDGMFNVYYLTNNYRNSQQVLEMSQQIISQVTKKIDKVITPVYNSEGNVTVMSKTNLPEVLRQISREENYKDWFLLVRTNKELYELAEKCAEYEVPYTTFKREGMSLSELRQRMNMNKVKVLTVHVSKGLEAKNVLLYGNFPIVCPNYRKDEEERKVMYVGVTRAIDNLYILN